MHERGAKGQCFVKLQPVSVDRNLGLKSRFNIELTSSWRRGAAVHLIQARFVDRKQSVSCRKQYEYVHF